MIKEKSPTIVAAAVIALCAERLRRLRPLSRAHVRVAWLTQSSLTVTLSYTKAYRVSVAPIEVDEDTKGTGAVDLEYLRTPETSGSTHWSTLAACLDAIVSDPVLNSRLSDMSTDGDNKDCEAIFCVDGEQYYAVSVRC